MSGRVSEAAGFATERAPGSGILRVTCLTCNKVTRQPDKGMGRANIAAWKSRHKHTTPPTATQPRTPAGSTEEATS